MTCARNNHGCHSHSGPRLQGDCDIPIRDFCYMAIALICTLRQRVLVESIASPCCTVFVHQNIQNVLHFDNDLEWPLTDFKVMPLFDNTIGKPTCRSPEVVVKLS